MALPWPVEKLKLIAPFATGFLFRFATATRFETVAGGNRSATTG